MSRTAKSIKNIKVAVISQASVILMSFILRFFFLRHLGIENVGINGLFTNIISMISLTELGLGAALIYMMYKPLANNDEFKISALMNYFKKRYHLIGLIIGLFGLIFVPFLDLFLSETEINIELYMIYFLFLTNACVSYVHSYKQALLTADQNQYIVNFYRSIFLIIFNILQIIMLIITESFIIFMILQIFLTFFTNYLLSRKVDNLYPYLKSNTCLTVESNDAGEIKKNVKAMFLHKIGTFVVTGTDSILISIFVSITVVGQYANYLLIIAGLNSIFFLIFKSITASVGNLGATADVNVVYQNFKKVNLIGFLIFGFSSICLYILLDRFIILWLGGDYILPRTVVILIIINFYQMGMRQSTLTFRNSLGLFWYDRHKPLIESVINLIISLLLGYYFGAAGILLGTTISTILVPFWIEPYVLFKYGFKVKLQAFFITYLKRTSILIISLIPVRFIISFLPEYGLLSFILIVLTTCFLAGTFIILLLVNDPEFKFFKRLLLRKIKR